MPDSPLQTSPSSMHKIFDMVLKISGASLLAWLTFLLNYSNTLSENGNKLKQQEIDNSMKYGQFAQSMMQALVSKDSTGNNIARDMAFTVLNSTVVGGGKDSAGQKMIADVGYCIISDYYSNKKYLDITSNMQIILNIIKQRDTATYRSCTEIINQYASKPVINTSQVTNIEKKFKSKDSTVSISANITSSNLDRLTLLPAKATIFMQINDEMKRDSADLMLHLLKSKNYNTPRVQMLNMNYKSVIKYFYDADEAAANDVHILLLTTIKKDIPVKRVFNDKARVGILEFWYNCREDKHPHQK